MGRKQIELPRKQKPYEQRRNKIHADNLRAGRFTLQTRQDAHYLFKAMKGYMTIGLFFCEDSSFTLERTLRDNHESRKLINRVTEVKTERILQDYELKERLLA